MKRLGVILTILVLAAGLATVGYLVKPTGGQASRYRTVRVDRGAVVAIVSTTGNVNAVTTVQVSSQVSGQIRELFVDFNTPVKQHQLIARLDPEIFQAKVNAARADLESAEAAVLNQRANVEKVRAEVENVRASVATAQANVERVKAEMENARATIATAQANVARETATVANASRELERRLDLLRRELIAQSEKDQAQTLFDTSQAQLEAARSQERAGRAALRSAEAQHAATQSQVHATQAQVAAAQAALRVAEAQLKAAQAVVRQKGAALDQARADLDRTELRAPVDGVVVSRNVDVGQTVAASLQAPTLFTIAEDLTRMQVEAAVDEADIGRLREGMPTAFTVDAFPGRTFQGTIVQIRKAPQVVQNVVTYTTVIAVGNPDRILMPGMTANVRIQVERRDDALRVPNAALRFRPPTESGTDAARSTGAPSQGASERTPAQGASGRGGSREEVRETLTKELALTADQRARLDAILDASRQAFMALRGQGFDEKAMQAQRRRVRGESRERIREILTPEQQKTYDALVAAQEGAAAGAPAGTPGRVFAVGLDGRPAAVPIFVGATDGSYSEVLRGDLQPGQEIIVGIVPGATRGGAGPSLRL